MSTPTGFILAGGASRRMHQDKCLLDWHGRSLLEHMTALLQTVSDDVRIVGRRDLPDSPSGLGPIGGISTALRATQREDNLMVAVDLPLLTKEFLKYFKERFERTQHPLTVCRIDGRYPLCIGIRKSFSETVDAYLASGGRSLHSLITQVPHEVVGEADLASAFDISQLFLNINTPSDYRAAVITHKP